MLITAIVVLSVLVIDLFVDIRERFLITKKKRSVWMTVLLYTIFFVLNLLAIIMLALTSLETVPQ